MAMQYNEQKAAFVVLQVCIKKLKLQKLGICNQPTINDSHSYVDISGLQISEIMVLQAPEQDSII
jgi:hypothetical protein